MVFPGLPRAWQREAIELKGWHPGQRDPLTDGLHQLDTYLGRLNLDHGTLVIFDRRNQQPAGYQHPEFSKEHTPSGRAVTLLHA